MIIPDYDQDCSSVDEEPKPEEIILEKWVVDDLLDLTKEAMSYTPQVFRDKWNMDEQFKNLHEKIKDAGK